MQRPKQQQEDHICWLFEKSIAGAIAATLTHLSGLPGYVPVAVDCAERTFVAFWRINNVGQSTGL